jgi:hypothetical protein
VAMKENQLSGLGKCRILSFMPSMPFVDEDDCVLYDNLRIIQEYLGASKPPHFFEKAGPTEKVYLNPAKPKCGIVTWL